MRQDAFAKLTGSVGQNGCGFTTSEATAAGVSARTLYRLYAAGKIARLARGIYQAVDSTDVRTPDYEVIAKRVPDGVVCLLSALYHYELTAEIPDVIYLAISRRANVPRLDYPRVRIFRMSDAVFTKGVGSQVVGGVTLNMTSPEKTIADCFKYRMLVGMAVAIEALKRYMAKPGRRPNVVLEMAQFCRVAKIVRPYLEALL